MTYSILRGLRLCLLALLLSTAGANALAAGYHAQAGKIYDANNQEIQIRGISHFGFNSQILVPHYLWQMGWKEQIAQIKSLGFNAIRVPFVPDTLYNTRIVSDDCPQDLNPVYCTWINPSLNPELIGKTPLQILDLWMAEADRQGLYVMLDFHSVSRESQNQTWWYNGSLYNGRPEIDPVSGKRNMPYIYNGQPYTADNWRRDLTFVADRYKTLPHFFGIDLFNEPRDDVRWASGAASSDYYWKNAAESASAAVLAANPNLLIFVQGMTGNYDGIENSNIPMNWGENLQPEAYQLLNIPDDKLVLAPHTYGPDVYVKSSFGAANFPANLAADWEALFGQFSPTHPVVVGEWGGRYGNGTSGQQDVTWQNAFVDYLNSKNIHSSFYWCYTPNSGDTGGILNDDLTVREDKMALLRRHWDTSTALPSVAENIYTDAPGTNWHVTGWNTNWSEQTNPVYQGTTSLLARYTGEWGGLIFERRDSTNTPMMIAPADFSYVTFAVNPGATVSSNLNTVVVYLDNGSDSKPLINYLPGNAWVANQWQVVRIPIADLNSTNTNYYRVIVQSQVQAVDYGFSIDAVGLDNGGAPPSSGGGSGTLQTCAGTMPLGDSITVGINGGYRNNLYTGLQQNNCGIDYVGTQYDANTTVADKDNEGHPGYTIVDVAREVNPWLAAKQPNAILLMIGTNDTAWWTNEDGPEIATRHNALIDQLQAQRPDAWIFVATTPPQSSQLIHGKPDGNNQTTSVDRAVLTQDFNAAVRTNVQARVASGQKVRLVDVNSVLTTADLYDGIHPTTSGEAKIATAFLDAIRAVLSGT